MPKLNTLDEKAEMQGNAASYIADMQQKIHEALGPFVPNAPYALLDFPDIRNVGDSAIWVGERVYFRKYLNRGPSYSCVLQNLSPERLDQIVPEGPIFIHGGGNFGDIWVSHQNFRERVLQQWPDRPVIQLPQSLHFDSDERLQKTRRIVNAHKNFTLLVRDEYSLEFARKHFDCQTILCPDMAFMIGALKPDSAPQFPILAMLRKDKEQVERDQGDNGIPTEDWITEEPGPIKRAALLGIAKAAPTLSRARMRTAKYEAKADQRLRRGVKQLSRAQTIITDRLHVHIISLLLGKKHAVLDNSYGKIGRFRSAFPEPPGLTYTASSFEDAEEWARQQG